MLVLRINRREFFGGTTMNKQNEKQTQNEKQNSKTNQSKTSCKDCK